MKKEIYLRIDGNGNFVITRRIPKTRIGEAIIKLILNYTPPKIYTLEYNIPTPDIPTDITFDAPQTGLHLVLAKGFVEINSIDSEGKLTFKLTQKGLDMASLAGKSPLGFIYDEFKISSKVIISL